MKKVCVFALLLGVLGLVSACGGGGSTSREATGPVLQPGTKPSSEKVGEKAAVSEFEYQTGFTEHNESGQRVEVSCTGNICTTELVGEAKVPEAENLDYVIAEYEVNAGSGEASAELIKGTCPHPSSFCTEFKRHVAESNAAKEAQVIKEAE